jgi:nucleoid DNA-binding protein
MDENTVSHEVLADRIASKLGMHKKHVREMMTQFLKSFADALQEGEEVYFYGVGIFRRTENMLALHEKGEEPLKFSVSFRADATLLKKVNGEKPRPNSPWLR